MQGAQTLFRQARVGTEDVEKEKSPLTPLALEVMDKIDAAGPMPVAEFMELCLTHPTHGFYMHGEQIGRTGHFITSPELTSMFGELVGVWVVSMVEAMEAAVEEDPAVLEGPLLLVELGPGHGTLVRDALSALKRFPRLWGRLEVHLVEVSPVMQARQREALGCTQREDGLWVLPDGGPAVSWHESLDTVPTSGLFFAVAHELFDALPVRLFERAARGWRERVVVVDESEDGPHHFRVVTGEEATPGLSALGMDALATSEGGPAGAVGRSSAPSGPPSPAAAAAAVTGPPAGGPDSSPADTELRGPSATRALGESRARDLLAGLRPSASAVAAASAAASGPASAAIWGADGIPLSEALRPPAPTAPARPAGVDAGMAGASTAAIVPVAAAAADMAAAFAALGVEVPAGEEAEEMPLDARRRAWYSTAPAGQRVEASEAAARLAFALSRRVVEQGGATLVVDYGEDGASEESVRGIFQHRFVSLLHAPGETDITADVDFRALRHAAEAAPGAEVWGPVTQGLWLQRMGLWERAQQAKAALERSEDMDAAAKAEQAGRLDAVVHRLTDEREMGRVFKVMAWAPMGTGVPAGFAEAGGGEDGGEAGERVA